MTDHVGYAPHDPAGHHSGNSRNGTRTKTVITDVGPVELDVPRDRAGTFEPLIVPKRQRRLGGVDQMVLSLSAKGLTHGEISARIGRSSERPHSLFSREVGQAEKHASDVRAGRPEVGACGSARGAKMRIALLPSAFWPAVGGVEELTRRLAAALTEAGEFVEVWAPMDSLRSAPRQEVWSGLAVRRFPMTLPPRSLSMVARTAPTMLQGLWQLRQAVADFRPDVLHVQCFGPNGAYATVLSTLSGVPLVVSLHGETVMDNDDIYERSALLRAALRLGLRRAAAVTGCSAFTLSDAQRFGLRAGEGKVVFNGVSLVEPFEEGDERGTADERVPFARYVLALGRAVDKKGFDLLLRSFRELGPPEGVGLVIGGDGAALGPLRELAAELGIAGRVHFPGRLGRAAVAGLMRAAEVFVMPSRLEPFGIVVLEAWREGAAVVATSRGGPPEFIKDGEDGLLVDPFNIGALASAIGGLLQDPSRRAELARRGKERVAAFSWSLIAPQYSDIYRSVARSGRLVFPAASLTRLNPSTSILRPAAFADQVGLDATAMRVMRVSHSSVVTRWRSREHWLEALGAQVSLVTARRWTEIWGETALDPLPGERVTGVRTFGRQPCGFLYEPVALWKALRSVPHDILDVQEEPYSVAAAEVVVLHWLACPGVPLVIYSAQNLQKHHPLPVRIAERLVLASAKGAYPCNGAAATNLRRKGFHGVVQVLPLGVDMPERNADDSIVHLDTGPASFRVGCAGSLTVQKGFHLLVDAVAAPSSWQLTIAGDGPERDALFRRAVDRGSSERVRFLGFCGAEAMANFYQSIDVMVVPSIPVPGLEEQFGRVVVEAMAMGVPVVSTTSGSLPEVVGDAGLLVPPGDPEALRGALARLEREPELRRSLAEKGLQRASSCSWEAVARQQLALYRSAMVGSHRQGSVPPEPDQAPTEPLPALEVIVVAYGRPELLANALAPLRSDSPQAQFPVLVVDNSSNELVRAVVESHGGRYIDPGANLGFAAAVNVGIANLATEGSDVLLLNPDAEIDTRTVSSLQHRLHAESRLACVAPAQESPDGQPQQVSWPFPSPGRFLLQALGFGRVLERPGFLIGSVLLVNGAALREVGVFDETFFLYSEETDWQRRARDAGWGSRLCDDLHALHVGAATSSDDPEGRELLFAAGQERYLRKWYGKSGWALSRTATVAGALVRAVLLPSARRRAALNRARVYGAGPVRLVSTRLQRP